MTHGVINGGSDVMDSPMLSFYAGSLVLITVTLKMILMISHWTTPIYLALGISMAGYMLVFIGLEVVGFLEPGVFSVLHSTPLYYLGLIIIPVICLLPDYTIAYYLRQYKPSDAQIIQEDQRLARMKQAAAAAGKSKNGKNVQDDMEDQEAMMEMDIPKSQRNGLDGDEEEEDNDDNHDDEDEDEDDMEAQEKRGGGVAEKAAEKA